MNELLEKQLDLPPIYQIGMVVKNMEKAKELYEPIFGPFDTFEVEIEDAEYRGEIKSAKLHLGLAKKTGDLEIELFRY